MADGDFAPREGASRLRSGDVVGCNPDTGCASPGTLLGVVESAGPRQVWVTWESGIRQRLRSSALAQIWLVADPNLIDEAVKTFPNVTRRAAINRAIEYHLAKILAWRSDKHETPNRRLDAIARHERMLMALGYELTTTSRHGRAVCGARVIP